ncbi:hypothetical protein [Flavicella sp.]|uniref:hypothetical protein n=1 Tax=Flavicella sp. TaxID=2957742 RepID=UPI0030171FA6
MKILFTLLLGLVFTTSVSSQSLLIYGGNNHDVFLGCLNCDKYKSSSIWNEYGDNGSKYNSNCIWNEHGNYSGIYSDNSPFNKYALHPPILVDSEGNFYGYFTADIYYSKRTTNKFALMIIDDWEVIMEDVGEAYEKFQNRFI